MWFSPPTVVDVRNRKSGKLSHSQQTTNCGALSAYTHSEFISVVVFVVSGRRYRCKVEWSDVTLSALPGHPPASSIVHVECVELLLLLVCNVGVWGSFRVWMLFPPRKLARDSVFSPDTTKAVRNLFFCSHLNYSQPWSGPRNTNYCKEQTRNGLVTKPESLPTKVTSLP